MRDEENTTLILSNLAPTVKHNEGREVSRVCGGEGERKDQATAVVMVETEWRPQSFGHGSMRTMRTMRTMLCTLVAIVADGSF